MITGKYLENPALYSPDELERLDNHIEKYFGKATTVVHEFFSEDMGILFKTEHHTQIIHCWQGVFF